MRALFGNFSLSCPPLSVACDDDCDDCDVFDYLMMIIDQPVDVVEHFRSLVVDHIVLPDLRKVLETPFPS